jgi:DNA-directed RNA polymerase specialized sigma24 family protein
MPDERHGDRILLAILRLAIADREERAKPDLVKRRVEVLLDEAGLSYQEIATLVGKKPDAVRMLISRSKQSRKRAPKQNG